MFIQTGTIGIIADDLTGANDTALQFNLSGANTQILFDYAQAPEGMLNTQVWAISTETRNADKDEAVPVVRGAVKILDEKLNAEYYYKKIDSTIRGNIGTEAMTVLNELDWDACVVVPAFPAEGRTTVGGYHLLNGVPMDRTEMARDPKSPVKESHIPTLLASQVGSADIIGSITLKTVTKGAAPILLELQQLISNGKKLIVVDAVSTTDIEQIALAVEKSSYKILPCGAAALAKAFADIWLPEAEYQHISKTIPDNPIFVVSGSATTLARAQIERLVQDDDFEPYVLDLTLENVSTQNFDEIVDRVAKQLVKSRLVIVNFTTRESAMAQNIEYAQNNGVDVNDIPSIVTDYLARLAKDVVAIQDVILVTVGGETSYKVCSAIGSSNLQVIDEADSAIPLCLDFNARWIITKSGNLGNSSTLVNIIKYIERHK